MAERCCVERRFIGVEDRQWDVEETVHSLAELVPSFQWLPVKHHLHRYERDAAFMVVPNVIPRFPATVQRALRVLLERMAAGYFDLGRYLSERACQSQMKKLILEPVGYALDPPRRPLRQGIRVAEGPGS
jgi:hypothetical protein